MPAVCRRYGKVSVPHLRRAFRRNRLHSRRRPRYALCQLASGLQDGVRVLHDGTAGVCALAIGCRHTQPNLFPARARHADEHRLYGTGRADGQPGQRAACHRGAHRSVGLRLEPEAHHRFHRGTGQGLNPFPRREPLPPRHQPASPHTFRPRRTHARRKSIRHRRYRGPFEAIRFLPQECAPPGRRGAAQALL